MVDRSERRVQHERRQTGDPATRVPYAMGGMKMDEVEEPGVMMASHHAMFAWVDLVLLGFGLWLIASPSTLGYTQRAATWSDVASGLLLILFSLLSYPGRRTWAPWASVIVGTWLIFAPIVLWASDPGFYANDTLVGALVIAFAILIPHGMKMPGPEIPRGWSYNPSTWAQRVPIIALGLIGFLLSRYMAAYQLGHIDSVWDPFFGAGTSRILESEVSKMFPVSDAGLGASVYLLEVLMTAMGDPRRWRTMPWMVAFFAILVVPLGVTSIVLVVLQPLAVGAWCTLCLIAALAMLIMVPLTLDEVLAMGQFLRQERAQGKSLWRSFWVGGNVASGLEARPARPVDSTAVAAALWGVTIPWTLLATALLGGWLLVAPVVLGTADTLLGDSDRLVGSLVITFAFIGLAEVMRAARFVNVVVAAWLLVSPWVFGASGVVLWSEIATALLLAVLSLPRGAVVERYGDWQPYVR